MRKRILAVCAASALALSLSGCGMFGGGPPGGGDEQQRPGTAGAASAPAEQGSAPPQSGKAIATKEVEIGGTEILVEIIGLRRQGRLATLEWTITNQGDAAWSMGQSMGGDGMGLTVAGVSLIDTQNGKRYKTARSAGNNPQCVCSEYVNTLDPDRGAPLSATFAAPPPGIKSVNVDLRVLGVMRDVPIA